MIKSIVFDTKFKDFNFPHPFFKILFSIYLDDPVADIVMLLSLSPYDIPLPRSIFRESVQFGITHDGRHVYSVIGDSENFHKELSKLGDDESLYLGDMFSVGIAMPKKLLNECILNQRDNALEVREFIQDRPLRVVVCTNGTFNPVVREGLLNGSGLPKYLAGLFREYINQHSNGVVVPEFDEVKFKARLATQRDLFPTLITMLFVNQSNGVPPVLHNLFRDESFCILIHDLLCWVNHDVTKYNIDEASHFGGIIDDGMLDKICLTSDILDQRYTCKFTMPVDIEPPLGETTLNWTGVAMVALIASVVGYIVDDVLRSGVTVVDGKILQIYGSETDGDEDIEIDPDIFTANPTSFS